MKKLFIKIFALAILSVVALTFVACNDNSGQNQGNNENNTVSYSLNSSLISIEIGEQFQLELLGENVDKTKITWESGNSQKATVEDGLITGVSVGRTVIIVNYNEEELYCVVSVVEPSAAVPVLDVDSSALRMLKGTTASRIATVKYENSTVDAVVNYSSSNESVVRVENGVITANGVGSAVITITSSYKDVELYQTIEVSVIDYLVLFDDYAFALGLNQSKTLEGKLWLVDGGLVNGATFTYALEESQNSSYVSINGNTISVTSIPQTELVVNILVSCSYNGTNYTDVLQLSFTS